MTPVPRPRSWLDPVSAWASFGLPLLLTSLRASTSSQWRDDLAVVRGLGLVPIGGEGTVSTVLVQGAALLPFGGKLLRAALVNALGLAVLGWLVYLLGRRLLEANGWTPRLTPPLALSAALLATLAPAPQLEGTLAGGVTVAAALALAGLALRPARGLSDARLWLAWGALVAAAACENHAAGAALLVALLVQIRGEGALPPRRGLLLALVGFGVTAALCLSPLLLRPLAERAWVDLGLDLVRSSSGSGSGSRRVDALQAWLGEVGVVGVVLAGAGVVMGLATERLRVWLAPLLVLVVADLALPAERVDVLATDSLAVLRLLALAALAIAGVLGVQTLALWLAALRLPWARSSAALLVAFHGTLVVMSAEDAAWAANRSEQHAAEAITDEALGALPPRALVLTHSEAMTWRLWAARVVKGERPDVVVVPLTLLGRGSVASRLLELEPRLAPLVRDVAVEGRPKEQSLTTLADARPLFVELDASWDPRLWHHLTPEGVWLGFHPFPVGRSDRREAAAANRAALRRMVTAVLQPGVDDQASRAALGRRLEDQARVLAALGDREALALLAPEIERLGLRLPDHATDPGPTARR